MVALLASPLLGPAVWQPVAQALRQRGVDVVAAAASRPTRSAADVRQRFLADVPADRDVVAVPHSNAGAYVPALVAQRRVVASVFVDAVLPPRAGHIALAPPELVEMLVDLADEQRMLPPWTAWWGEDGVTELFPSDAVRRQVEAEQQRLPLTYFTESMPVAPGWDDRPCGYLSFGDTYAAEHQEAAARGWPVARLDGMHLHMLHSPDAVAAAVLELLRRLGVQALRVHRGT